MVYLVAAALAWIVAQSLKHVARLLGRNRRIFHNQPRHGLLLSGGMPSAHSATVVALTTIIGLNEGINSSIFALAVLMSAIVMYDAVMVRYSSGEQGNLLNRLLKNYESSKLLKPVRVAHGHTPVEVAAGACVGLVVGLVVSLL